jgi:uncharacterized protein involved in exopolysaccharide biosynthesis
MEHRYSFIKTAKIILKKWYYLFFAMLLTFIGGYFFLYLTVPLYTSNASIKIDDKKSELSESVLKIFMTEPASRKLKSLSFILEMC